MGNPNPNQRHRFGSNRESEHRQRKPQNAEVKELCGSSVDLELLQPVKANESEALRTFVPKKNGGGAEKGGMDQWPFLFLLRKHEVRTTSTSKVKQALTLCCFHKGDAPFLGHPPEWRLPEEGRPLGGPPKGENNMFFGAS